MNQKKERRNKISADSADGIGGGVSVGSQIYQCTKAVYSLCVIQAVEVELGKPGILLVRIKKQKPGCKVERRG